MMTKAAFNFIHETIDFLSAAARQKTQWTLLHVKWFSSRPSPGLRIADSLLWNRVTSKTNAKLKTDLRPLDADTLTAECPKRCAIEVGSSKASVLAVGRRTAGTPRQ